jgi:hypothetical protein
VNPTVVGWTYLGVGTVLIGLGGLLTTKGWNTLAARDQQMGAVRSLAHELAANDRMINAALELAQRWPTRPETETFSYEHYHELPLAAMVAAGALDSENSADQALRECLDGYQQAIAQFNAGLAIVKRSNPGMFLKTDLIHVRDVNQWPKRVEDTLSESFGNLLLAHTRARDCVRARYPTVVTQLADVTRGKHEAA